jgi:tetratricopeptide (TPR) repeat protein
MSGDKTKHAYANQLALDFYAGALNTAQKIMPAVPAKRIMEIYQRRGEVWRLLSRYPEAIAESERMLEFARAAGDRRSEGEALLDLALSYWYTFSWEHIPQTTRFAEEALAVAREIGDQHMLAKSLSHLGLMDTVNGNLVEGDRKYAESLRIGELGEFTDVIPQNLFQLGAHANWRGEFQTAVVLCRRGAQVASEIHDGFFELSALAFQCLPHIGLGEYTEALAVIDEGLSKARDRNNTFFQGRLINTLGWLHQELGDFRRSVELDRESADLGARDKNSNVEISALINLGLDYLNLGEPQRALSLLEETLVRMEKFAFGAHRWRWSIHLAAYLAETLLATGEPQKALVQVEKGLAQACSTGSMKYIAKFHALRGETAFRAQQWSQAEADLGEALRIAQRIGYPTLTWQAAHLLARTRAGQDKVEDAFTTARLAADTIEAVAARIPDSALQQTFLAWHRVQSVREDLDRFRRA